MTLPDEGGMSRRTSIVKFGGLVAATLGVGACKSDSADSAAGPTAIKGAAVDIWHCDAAGNYSGFGGGASSRTFLRGIQRTNAKGVATFTTIYPGWYTGRAVHIHVKVHVGGQVVHTGQLFFSDALTDRVFKRSPYNKRSARDTRNADDSIYRNGGSKGLLTMRRHGSGYVGAIAMGVHRS